MTHATKSRGARGPHATFIHHTTASLSPRPSIRNNFGQPRNSTARGAPTRTAEPHTVHRQRVFIAFFLSASGQRQEEHTNREGAHPHFPARPHTHDQSSNSLCAETEFAALHHPIIAHVADNNLFSHLVSWGHLAHDHRRHVVEGVASSDGNHQALCELPRHRRKLAPDGPVRQGPLCWCVYPGTSSIGCFPWLAARNYRIMKLTLAQAPSSARHSSWPRSYPFAWRTGSRSLTASRTAWARCPPYKESVTGTRSLLK